MNTLVQPDPGLYIWTIATFLVLVALLAKFAWRPLLEALDRRQESIRKSLDDAQKARQELERLGVESQRILAAARCGFVGGCCSSNASTKTKRNNSFARR